MRVLHAALMARPSSGIFKQMAWEQDAAHELGLQWCSRVFCPASIGDTNAEIVTVCPVVHRTDGANLLQRAQSYLKLRWQYYRWLRKIESEYDVLVLRYAMYDPLQYFFVRQSSKPIYFVHHTKEVPELNLVSSCIGRGKVLLERIIGPPTLRQARRLICVTQEIADYEAARVGQSLPASLIYPNGIHDSTEPAGDIRGTIPEILFVASNFVPWHGLDYLLCSTLGYDGPFTLHLVGLVGDEDRAIAEKDDRIVIHGLLSHEQITELAANCHVGLASFALERKQMQQACTLKVREYLKLGLPVYAGYRDVFPEDFAYFRKGPCDMEAIIEAAHQWASSSRREIASAAEPYINKTALLNKLADSIANDVLAQG